jgi:hypothetical protein
MTAAADHAAAKAHTRVAIATLLHWVAAAQCALDGGKLDGITRARLGELILSACRYLSEIEAATSKAAARAAYAHSSSGKQAR